MNSAWGLHNTKEVSRAREGLCPHARSQGQYERTPVAKAVMTPRPSQRYAGERGIAGAAGH